MSLSHSSDGGYVAVSALFLVCGSSLVLTRTGLGGLWRLSVVVDLVFIVTLIVGV